MHNSFNENKPICNTFNKNKPKKLFFTFKS